MDQKQIDNIPIEIKMRDRWLGMLLRQNNKMPDKPMKIPSDPKTGRNGSSTDSNKWGTFDQAISALSRYQLHGIGFALGDGVIGFDIDNCIANGQICPEAQEVIALINSYTEVSFSGNGVHILAFGKKPNEFKQCKQSNFNGKESDLEVYDGGRYFVMTGNQITNGEMRQITDKELVQFYNRYFGQARFESGLVPETSLTFSIKRTFADNEIMQLASLKYGQEFQDQLNGLNPIKSGDISANDLSLCNKLSSVTSDPDQIDRIFRTSLRNRPEKWDKVHFNTGETYGDRTIKMAIRGKNVYQERSVDWLLLQRPLTDLDVAREFAEKVRDNLIYTDGQGWLAWKDNVWSLGDHDSVILFEKYIDSLRKEAGSAIAAANTDDQMRIAKKFNSETYKLRATCRIESCLKLAKHALYVHDDELDANPFELNTPDGVVDLFTGIVRPANPKNYSTMITGCGLTYTETGICLWNDFLDKITNDDSEYLKYLNITMSQVIIGKVMRENLLLAFGGGGNGKSTFFNCLYKVCGSYATGIDPSILLNSKQNNEPALMALKGKRFVLANETEEGQRMSTSQLKKIASTDQITGRRLYHDQMTFSPSHTMVIFTNHLPKVSSTDTGTWDRLIVLPFTHKWDRKSKDTILDYASILFHEAGGAILNWLIEGAVLFLAAGGHVPQCATLEMAICEYKDSEDWLSNFISDTCEIGSSCRCTAHELYQTYRNWANSNNEYVRRQQDFVAALSVRGFTRINPGNRKTWIGICPANNLLEASTVDKNKWSNPYDHPG